MTYEGVFHARARTGMTNGTYRNKHAYEANMMQLGKECLKQSQVMVGFGPLSGYGPTLQSSLEGIGIIYVQLHLNVSMFSYKATMYVFITHGFWGIFPEVLKLNQCSKHSHMRAVVNRCLYGDLHSNFIWKCGGEE